MDNLRLILILIGLVILALIWFLHKPDGARRPGASRREPRLDTRREAAVDAEAATGSEHPADSDGESPVQPTIPDLEPEPEADSRSASWSESRPEPATRPARREPVLGDPAPPPPPLTEPPQDDDVAGAPLPSDPPKIVTLYLRARGSRKISGLSLLDAAIKAGLRFGEMKIFHRRHRGEPRPVFSMANIARPGSFDPSGWNLFETHGVTLFMTLPGPVSALDAWDAMLATGQRLSGILEADLLDDGHTPLTRQRVAQIRDEMRDFDRKAGLP